MTQITKISCNFCDKDLTHPANSMDFRLLLVSQLRQPATVHTGLAPIRPIVKYPVMEDHHFCDLVCLARWLKPKEDVA